ncbi:hypothetical protein [uncultured Friedmanniella sp.]|uniref:hypothetical protein n=1 Tax=uncultured Friedmanniella sp. TaxID=335381 RepID=UPI0035CBF1A4
MSEYESAFLTFLWECVDPLMKAIDPVYAQIPHRRSDVLRVDPIRTDDGREIPVAEPLAVSTDLIMSYERAIAGDFTEISEIVERAAHATLSQVMPGFYELIDRTTMATGNVVDAGGVLTYDALLDALEKVHISEFDEAGQPVGMSLLMNPATAQNLQALGSPTAEQDARYKAIMQRKREEADAGRRHRRVPRDRNGTGV